MARAQSVEQAYKAENFKFVFMIVCIVTAIEMAAILVVWRLAINRHTHLSPSFSMFPSFVAPILMVPVMHLVRRKPTPEMQEHFVQTGRLPEKATFRPAMSAVSICAFIAIILMVGGFMYSQAQHLRHFNG
jgi:hypothetical protein